MEGSKITLSHNTYINHIKYHLRHELQSLHYNIIYINNNIKYINNEISRQATFITIAKQPPTSLLSNLLGTF